MHSLWLALLHQFDQVRATVQVMVFLEILRAFYVAGRNRGETKALESGFQISDAEFERRHGSAGWFENDKPEVRMTRFQRFMLWLGFELE
jgi:hypothetical protein